MIEANPQCSKSKFIRYLEYIEKPDLDEVYHCLSKRGQKTFRFYGVSYVVDYYDPIKRKVVELLGCYYHGCPKCKIPGNYGPGGRLHRHSYQDTLNRMKKLRASRLFKSVEFVWECEYKKKLTLDLDSIEIKELDVTLSPGVSIREAYRGGLCETYALVADCGAFEPRKSHQAQWRPKVQVLDLNSAYSAFLMKDGQGAYDSATECPFIPLGKAVFLTGNTQCSVSCTDDCTSSCEKHCSFDRFDKVAGLAAVTVICPSTEPFPVLQSKVECKDHQNRSMSFSCKKCGTVRAEVMTFTNLKCTCPDSSRAFSGTYTFPEIVYAVKYQGYRVKVHEVMFWPHSRRFVFSQFVGSLAKVKLTSSKIPEGLNKEQWARKIRGAGFPEVKAHHICPDQALNELAKTALTTFVGKFSQCPSKTFRSFVQNYESLIAAKKNEDIQINQFELLGPHTLMIGYEKTHDLDRMNRKGNCALGAIVNGLCRVEIVKALSKASHYGYQPLMCSTDSIAVMPLSPECQPLETIFPVSPRIGHWKKEASGTFFLSLGHRSYVLLGDEGETNISKVCGLRKGSLDLTMERTRSALLHELLHGVCSRQGEHPVLVPGQRTVRVDPTLPLHPVTETLGHRLLRLVRLNRSVLWHPAITSIRQHPLCPLATGLQAHNAGRNITAEEKMVNDPNRAYCDARTCPDLQQLPALWPTVAYGGEFVPVDGFPQKDFSLPEQK